jgi:hypothetical protein
MSFSSWPRNRHASAPAARGRARTCSRRGAGYWARFESLEVRSLLSGLPYPTAANVSQLVADLNSVDQTGGTFTINLKPGTSFGLNSANNTTDGANGLPVIGGAKAVNLTIVGNGDTIERIANRRGSNPFRLFDVAPGTTLTLDHVRLQGGLASGPGAGGNGGGIYNRGTLRVINSSTLNNNSAVLGGSIYSGGGTVTVDHSTLLVGGLDIRGGALTVDHGTLAGLTNNGATVTMTDSTPGRIVNASGTMTVTNCSISGSADSGGATPGDTPGNPQSSGGGVYNSGTMTISNSAIAGSHARWGGGIYNTGTLSLINSTLTGNYVSPDYFGYGGYGGGIYNAGGNLTISHGVVTSNNAYLFGLGGGGGGIFNSGLGTVTVKDFSNISGNTSGSDDVPPHQDALNLGVVYLDSTSVIGVLDGQAAIRI